MSEVGSRLASASRIEAHGAWEADALGRQLAALRPRMTSVALRFAPDRDAAEDIVQNALVKALRGHARFRGQARLSTWLHRIVVNESLMWLRSQGRRLRRHGELDEAAEADPVEPSLGPAETLAARRRRERVWAGLRALSEDEREVLVHCALRERSYEAFGAERGLGAAAVKSRAFRARRRLREVLATAAGEPDA